MTSGIAALGSGMGLVLAAWAAAATACLGWGLLWYRLWRAPVRGGERLFLAFWTGFALVLAVMGLWHFVRPLDGAAVLGLLAVGAGSLVAQRGSLRPLARAGPIGWAAAALWALWTANQCLRPIQHYDTGLYLLGGASWFAQLPLVPGLGNLHGRFAFNNANLLFAALFERGPWLGRAPNVLNGLLLAVFVLQCAHAARPLLRPGAARAGAAFAALLPIPALLLANRYLVSLSTDFCVTLLVLVAAWRVFRLLAGEVAAESRRSELASLGLLAATAVSVKLSALVFVAGLAACAVAASWCDAAPGERRSRDALVAASVFVAVLLPWLVRGVVLSGYPLYPSELVTLPVDWRVPAAAVANEAESVKAWARVPVRGVPREWKLAGWDWLESWLRRNGHFGLRVDFPLPLLLGASGLLAAALGRPPEHRAPSMRAVWLALPVPPALAFWFWTAPDPRFAMFVFWSFAATGVAVAVGVWSAAAPRLPLARALLAAVVACVLWIAPKRLEPPGPQAGFHPIPAVRTATFHTASGLALNVPVDTDQCWVAPQPCTPHPRASLRLRNESAPRDGFRR